MQQQIDEIIEKQGWDTQTMLMLALRYIDNQQDDACFLNFLRDAADAENEAED